MKNIWVLIGFLFASNANAQQLNLGAVLSGNTNDVVCYAWSAPNDPGNLQAITCDNKAGMTTGSLSLGKQARENAIVASFVGSGRWELATTYIGKNNITGFIFTKK